MVARYADFLDRHVQAGMRTMPTLIVGHMSGENWDPPWRGGRDLYGDVWMVARQAWFAGEMARRFKDHPGVAAWIVSNEMPIYGRPPSTGPTPGATPASPAVPTGPAPTEQVTSWAELVVQAIRGAGATQPVSIGDGAWGIEMSGVDNGFSVRELARTVDFLGPHCYPMDNDAVRLHLRAAFQCELAGFAGLPVLLEEFGVSSAFASDEHAADYYRQALHLSLLAGATGWIAWNNCDYLDLAEEDPYRHHAFEMQFGLVDSQGRPKPQLGELRNFAALLERIDVASCERPEADAAIVVPSYLEIAYPFTQPEDRGLVLDSVQQAYVAAKEADLPVGLMREADGLTSDCRLYLVPSTKQLTAPGWRRLERFAEDGAVVYVSYCAGAHGVQRGPWYADLNRMFGVEHQLRHGLVDPIEDQEVVVTFLGDFGSVPEGSQLTFRAGGNQHARAFLPVRPVEAEVVAVDQRDRPVLLERRLGAGRLLLCTYPLEHMAAVTPRVNPEPTYRIYDALAEIAGVRRPVTVEDPRVLAAELRHRRGHRFVWLVSQAAADLTVKPTVSGALADLDTGQPVEEVALRPYGVRVLRLLPAG
jgi:endo-1,4-beta-mannosidase